MTDPAACEPSADLPAEPARFACQGDGWEVTAEVPAPEPVERPAGGPDGAAAPAGVRWTWRPLARSAGGAVTIPPRARSWRVHARPRDDAAFAAVARAAAAARAPALEVDCARLSPDGLAPLRGLAHLRRLRLRAVPSFAADGVRDPRLTSRELGWLHALTGLEALALAGGRLRPGPVLKLLRRLPRLADLELTGCFSEGDDPAPARLLGQLRELLTLRALTVHGPSEYGEHPDWLDDAGLRALARVPRLEALDLWRCKRLTDAGVAALAGHPGLRALALGDPDHTWSPGDGALAAIAALPALRALRLHGCARAWGLPALERLGALPLEAFTVEACHLAPEARAWLEARFPGVTTRRAATTHLRWPG